MTVNITELIILAVILAVSWVFSELGSDMCIEYCGKANPMIRVDDRLEKMWDQQEAFMRLLQEKRGFPEFPTDLTSKKGQQFLKDIRNHLMEELFEAGQHLKNAKSHRATDIPEVDREAYMEELVDALHLYLELVIASGITKEELFDAYMKKGNVNFDRIKNGY